MLKLFVVAALAVSSLTACDGGKKKEDAGSAKADAGAKDAGSEKDAGPDAG